MIDETTRTTTNIIRSEIAFGVVFCFVVFGALQLMLLVVGDGHRHNKKQQQQQDAVTASTTPVQWTRHLKAALTLPFNVTVTVPILLTTVVGDGPKLFFGYYQLVYDSSMMDNNNPTIKSIIILSSMVIACVSLFMTGVSLLLSTNRLFHEAKGTLAPWDPPPKFVVDGPYRYVRNPMLSGVIMILFAETLLLGKLSLLGFACTFFVVNTFYFMTKEEPELRQRFGKDYEAYYKSVPRWTPRLTEYLTEDEMKKA